MVLAVNFKQTALYFALPFAVHAISILRIKSASPNVATEVDRVLYGIAWLGLVFVLTNCVLWAPWLISRNESGLFIDWESAGQVFHRIFPVRRGIFEDKVASFWCVLHYLTPLKVNTMFERSTQFQMTMGTTLLLCIPACYYLWKAPTPR
jgi:alpha-1,3-glucosyltransferase